MANLALFRPKGMPKNGLVGEYRFDHRNLLKHSEDFSNVVWMKENSTVLDNAVTETTDATAIRHGFSQTAGSFPGQPFTHTVEVKALSRNWVRLGDAYTGGGGYFDIGTGVTGTVEAPYKNVKVTALEDGWYRLSITRTSADAMSSLGLYSALSNGVINYQGDGRQAFQIRKAWSNPGNEPLPYQKTTDNQTLTDYSGKGNHGQLGSTTGADTNDPTWTGQGLSFTTDDYVKLPYMINAEQDFAIYVAVNVGASLPTANEWYIGMGNSGVSVQYAGLHRTTGGDLSLYTVNDAGASKAINLTAITGVRLIKIQREPSKMSIKDIASGNANATVNIVASPMTFNQISLGALVRQTVAGYVNQPEYFATFYNRATTDAEDQRVYQYLKRELAKRGVTLA